MYKKTKKGRSMPPAQTANYVLHAFHATGLSFSSITRYVQCQIGRCKPNIVYALPSGTDYRLLVVHFLDKFQLQIEASVNLFTERQLRGAYDIL